MKQKMCYFYLFVQVRFGHFPPHLEMWGSGKGITGCYSMLLFLLCKKTLIEEPSTAQLTYSNCLFSFVIWRFSFRCAIRFLSGGLVVEIKVTFIFSHSQSYMTHSWSTSVTSIGMKLPQLDHHDKIWTTVWENIWLCDNNTQTLTMTPWCILARYRLLLSLRLGHLWMN